MEFTQEEKKIALEKAVIFYEGRLETKYDNHGGWTMLKKECNLGDLIRNPDYYRIVPRRVDYTTAINECFNKGTMFISCGGVQQRDSRTCMVFAPNEARDVGVKFVNSCHEYTTLLISEYVDLWEEINP